MKPEQIDECFKTRRNGYTKYLKFLAKRHRRRIEKILLENAPKKNMYRGWSD